jgi:hypothetical protein
MTRGEYRKLKNDDVVGRKARLLRAVSIRSGLTFAAGTVVTIKRKFGGFHVEGEACRCCHVIAHCRDVDPEAIELL